VKTTESPFAVVFDVDGTLAPDTTSQFLATRGVDVEAFWSRSLERMHEGWDPVTSYLHAFVLESAGPHGPFTRAEMAAVAPQMALFPGVADLCERLSAHITERGMVAEFYLISGGLAPIVRNLPIAGQCRGIWASDFDYDDAGRPAFPRAIVDFADKTKRLVEISKGLTQADTQANPYLVNDPVGARGFRIPFTRIIFVGDGFTDVPCFSLLSSHGGGAIAVFDPSHPGAADRARQYQADGRVGWVAAADYTAGGEAFTALRDAIDALVGANPPPR
jgi:phosphoserine phosphatase